MYYIINIANSFEIHRVVDDNWTMKVLAVKEIKDVKV